jgi:hypothetical protein
MTPISRNSPQRRVFLPAAIRSGGSRSAFFHKCKEPLVISVLRRAVRSCPAINEKDYYVTEALRSQPRVDDKIIKRGTSLLDGWGLILRFSEDIDIFLDPEAFQPGWGQT